MEKIIVKVEDGMINLAELLELTKDIDPSKVTIEVGFEVPDWVWLEITVADK